MKQIIPFKKEITFKTMISKITSISLEHTLKLEEKGIISGDFIVSGSYKMTEASQIDEEFSYKVPIEIAIDSKYDTSNITLEIDDFVYEVENEEKLLLSIDLCIDNLELKPIEDKVESLFVHDEYEEFDNTLAEIEDALEDEVLSREEEIKEERNEDLFLDTSNEEKLEIPVNIDSVNTTNSSAMPEIMPYYPPAKQDSDSNSTTDNSVSSIFSAFKDTDETFSTYCIYIIREGDNLETVINKYKTTRDVLAEYNDLSDIRIGTKIIIPSNNE